MIDIGDAYLLLERDERSTGRGLLTRPAGVTTVAGDALLAVDARDTRRLLIPVVGEEVPVDRRSRGVALVPDELLTDGEVRHYAALVCLDAGLHRVFERLVEDTLQRVAAADTSPLRAVQQVLGEWRSFLSAAGLELGRETAVGLVGELEILARMHNVADPLDCWRGPLGSLHDFVHGDLEIEVKTTTSTEGNTIQISSLDQLDPASTRRLHLAVVHMRESDTAPSLEDRVEELLGAGLARDRFYDLLARQEYVHGRDPDAHRYEVRSVRLWRVDDRFPGIRRSDINQTRLRGVSKVNYALALDSAPSPQPPDVSDRLLRTMQFEDG